MPVLKNARHERFAVELSKGKTATEAYTLAGYRGDRTAASRLSTNVNIKARIAELQGAVAAAVVEDTAVDRARVIKELATVGLVAIAPEDVRPADKRAALVDIARIQGWIVERVETGQPGAFADVEAMSADELRSFLAAGTEAPGVRQTNPAGRDRAGKSGRVTH